MKNSKSYNDLTLKKTLQQQEYRQEVTRNDGPNRKNELDNSGGLKRVLSVLSLSLKSWSKAGSFDNNSIKKSPQNDVTDLPEETQDEHRLYRSLQDAGRNTDGVGAVEVWVLDRSESHGARLVQPPGGFWCSKYFIAEDYEALARINDKDRDDYVPPPPMMPGTGLAGALWNEKRNTVDNQKGQAKTSNYGFYAKGKSSLSRLSFASSIASSQSSSVKSFQSLTNINADYRHSSLRKAHSIDNANGLAWRDIRSVTVDPYMPTFLRLELMEAAGFKKCAGIHFDVQGTSGIVLFLANDQVRVSRLNLPDNVAYMKASANFVGSCAALVKHRIRLNSRINKQPRNIHGVSSKDRSSIYSNIATWLSKCSGGDLQPPPPMPLDEAALTFTGVFITILILQLASGQIERTTGSGVIFGPFGALVTLQFGLTMAPPAQPRNVIFGQATATIIALTFSHISEDYVGRHIRVSLTTATAIAAMVLLGIPHPPAGATALILSMGNYQWNCLPSVIISNLIAIVMSTLINNVSEKRQYPTFLYIGESILYDTIFGCCAPEDEFSTEEMYESKRLAKKASSELKEAIFLPNDDDMHNLNSDPEANFSSSPTVDPQIRKSLSFAGRNVDEGYFSSRPIVIPNLVKNSSPFERNADQDNVSRPVVESMMLGKKAFSFVRNADQIQNPYAADLRLLAPMDWSSGKKSSNSSRIQIMGDEEDGDIGMDLIENEASSQYRPYKTDVQIESAINDRESDIDTPFLAPFSIPLHANDTSQESVYKNESQQLSQQKNLSPLKEVDEMYDNHAKMNQQSFAYPMSDITYGSMFMMPTLEPRSVPNDKGEELSDDLSLESLDDDNMF